MMILPRSVVLAISESSSHCWHTGYGRIHINDAKYLDALKAQNAMLKGLLAEAEVESAALKKDR